MWLGLYERRTVSTFDLYARGVVWDVGSHVGLYALAASVRGARVHAFEPLSANVGWLERNLRVNGETATIHQHALGDTSGTLRFRPDGSRLEGRVEAGGAIAVDVRRGDDLPIPPPAVLKVDVEGAELAVLRGMVVTLHTHRPVVFVETHAPVTIRDVLDLLPDYRAEELEPRRYVCHP